MAGVIKTRTPVRALVLIDAAQAVPLWRQIYEQIRGAIASGRLAAGARLPASRALAADLVVSRNSVTAAYAQLRAEGYLVQRGRVGTFVASLESDRVEMTARPPRPPRARKVAQVVAGRRPLSRVAAMALAAAERLPPAHRGSPVPFRIGDPAIDVFPVRVWSRLVARSWRSGRVPLGYLDPAGARPLREAIAEYLIGSRGVRCEWQQVFIVSGTQQAVDVAIRLVLSPGDVVWIEDPCYSGARSAIDSSAVTAVSVPVDSEGISVDEGLRIDPKARGVYVTPSHQFPLGAVMSVSRRMALLGWAASADAWIIEDDYDSEFRYASRPLPSLQGLDEQGRVIYVGTFSKTLFPGLRVGYLVSPPGLVDAFQAAFALGGRYASADAQLVVTEFITEGHFERHLRRMRALYAARQAALLTYVQDHLSEWLDVSPSAAGLHLIGWIRDRSSSAAGIIERAAGVGVELRALSHYTQRIPKRDAILLGYAAFAPAAMEAAARRLGVALGAGRGAGRGRGGRVVPR
jgi:GntR family transcriptional regulator/MocR family aminotransferase